MMDNQRFKRNELMWNSQSSVNSYTQDYSETTHMYGSVTPVEGRWSNEHRHFENVKRVQSWQANQVISPPPIKDSVKTKPAEKGSFRNLLAGGIAGCASTLVTCPIDVIKTRQQSSGEIASSAVKIPVSGRMSRNVSLPQGLIRNALRAHYTVAVQSSYTYPSSMLQHGRYILHVEGIRSFYKGLGPSILGVVPSRALFFYSYEVAKKSLHRNFGFNPHASNTHIAASTFGGLICTTATCPLWVMKTKQQLHRRLNNTSLSMLECMKRVWQSEGIKGFYRGLTASYAGIVETVIYFTIYEQLKAMYIRQHNLDPTNTRISISSFWELPGLMIISSLSKCSATCLAYPHEVVRTRLREEPIKQKYNGFFQTLKCISAKEGVRGLYGGLPAQLIRQVPNMAILMGVYEGVLYITSR